VSGVVGANQNDGDLGMKSVDFAVLDSPENVRGGVAAESEVQRLARGVELLPGGKEIFIRRSRLVVVVGDGVADQQELRVGIVLDGVENRFVTVGPPGLAQAIGRCRGVISRFAEYGCRTKGDDCKCDGCEYERGKWFRRSSARVFHAAILKDE